MNNLHLPEWKLASNLQLSKTQGVIFGILIVLSVIGLIALGVWKVCLIKKYFGGLQCDVDVIDDTDLVIELGEDLDENGCRYTSDKDFV